MSHRKKITDFQYLDSDFEEDDFIDDDYIEEEEEEFPVKKKRRASEGDLD